MVRRVPSHATKTHLRMGAGSRQEWSERTVQAGGRRKSGSEGPAIGNLMLLKPRRNRLLAFIQSERIFVRRFWTFGLCRGGHGDRRFPWAAREDADEGGRPGTESFRSPRRDEPRLGGPPRRDYSTRGRAPRPSCPAGRTSGRAERTLPDSEHASPWCAEFRLPLRGKIAWMVQKASFENEGETACLERPRVDKERHLQEQRHLPEKF